MGREASFRLLIGEVMNFHWLPLGRYMGRCVGGELKKFAIDFFEKEKAKPAEMSTFLEYLT